MVPDAINSGRQDPPALRLDLNAGTLLNPPALWSGPRRPEEVPTALLAAGYQGLQDREPRPDVLACGLPMTGMARITAPHQAAKACAKHRGWGFQATTLHVGAGLESDDEASRLVEAVLEASVRERYPLFIETHRATITQDIRRTLDLIGRFPELRFNADLSHWYTGHEMTYGDFDAKLQALAPLFERVRFIHGRIGDSCCMQVAIEGAEEAPHVEHFRRLWTRCFDGFLKRASAGDEIVFAPELLPAAIDLDGRVHALNYARLDGHGEEQVDRWAEASRLCQIARDCFDAARRNLVSRKSAPSEEVIP